MSKRKSLISVQTFANGEGQGQTFDCRSSLPMDSANATESENAAVRIMQAVNAQLDYAKSKLRLVVRDIEKHENLTVRIPD